jgi:hypothetical protein
MASVLGNLSSEQAFWDLRPRGNELVFIGAAASRRDRDESIAYALADAALKVAWFYSMSGTVDVAQKLNNTYNDVQIGITYQLKEDIDFEHYIESLTYNMDSDILETQNTLFLKTHYTPAARLNVQYRRDHKNGVPEWISHSIDNISGFLAASGFAVHHQLDGDTYMQACKDAFFSLLQEVNRTISDENMSIEQNGNVYTQSTSIQHSSATLEGFYVLDIWIDPQTQDMWTLAIAKLPQQK